MKQKKCCKSFDVILPLVCNAKTSQGNREFAKTPNHVIFSHTLEKSCYKLFDCCKIVQELQSYHVDVLDWPDIGFNFLIGNDGRVYVGRGWNKISQFSHDFNEKSLSVAFIGNFFDTAPGPMALDTARNLIDCAVLKGYLMSNYTLHMLEDIECTANPAPGLKKKIQHWLHYKEKIPSYLQC
ncbi:peptidoglycan recognition protein 1 [Caerostris darwini]|uniref:Peptidoglycan recognition protein 1 n=1 Tax=Caerostris darwini TaxID=1538125 RepID=A0AAV4PTK2_9ARAC|nr:peptidoglycan recognition protein 1 [Caerostris darwini]